MSLLQVFEAYHASIRRVPSFIKLRRNKGFYTKNKFLDIIFAIPGVFKFLKSYFDKDKVKHFKNKVGIVAIVKNEASYIEEWINYYLSIGVDHFYIYDNNSTDNLVGILEKYQSVVTYIPFPGMARQMDAYNDALNRYGIECAYLAFLDADEFIYVKKHNNSLANFLDTFFTDSHQAALVVNWQLFGSSDNITRPQGLVTDAYVYRAEEKFKTNLHVKTILKPSKTAGFTWNPHAAIYLPRYYAVNENLELCSGPFTKYVSVKKIQINHYFTKSKEEYIRKKNRGQATNFKKRPMNDFYKHDKNDVFDDCLRIYNRKSNLK
ncbi:glycosyltransferase family 2 protein [Liquorilactobacillus mali]|uniref:glycosyltransferase family 2 protein n=1 Tax=Liquorilactobacillus mali TaxID=1618 RepID=UPI002953BE46|nr:glycosyltransferase family 2 protein [Liquorilactobacillus mali]MDC7952265.1 glycosyltransferase family 2 protein [Liquorilactobacillus mali]